MKAACLDPKIIMAELQGHKCRNNNNNNNNAFVGISCVMKKKTEDTWSESSDECSIL